MTLTKKKKNGGTEKPREGIHYYLLNLSQCFALSKLVLSDLYLKADREIPDC